MALVQIRCQSGRVVEHPSAQQVKAGAAVHLALEHLDPVHVALDLALAVRRRQGGGDGGVVALDAAHKADQFGDAAVSDFSQPRVEFLHCPCANDPAKVADEPLGGGDRWTLLAERFAVDAFVVIEVVDGAQQDPVCLAWREATSIRGRIGGVITPPTSSWSS